MILRELFQSWRSPPLPFAGIVSKYVRTYILPEIMILTIITLFFFLSRKQVKKGRCPIKQSKWIPTIWTTATDWLTPPLKTNPSSLPLFFLEKTRTTPPHSFSNAAANIIPSLTQRLPNLSYKTTRVALAKKVKMTQNRDNVLLFLMVQINK